MCKKISEINAVRGFCMKKLFALILALILTFSLAACEEDEEKTGNDVKNGTEVTFTLFNGTEYDFSSIAISETEKDNWSKNLLSGTLKKFDNVQIKITVKLDSDTPRQFELQGTTPDGEKFVFRYLDLSECTEKGGSISIGLTEGGDGMAMFSPPYSEPTLVLDSAPTKVKYKVGEEFDPAGFAATYTDDQGEEIELGYDDVKFIVSGTVELTAGRPFQTAGTKAVVVHYEDLTCEFEIVVE